MTTSRLVLTLVAVAAVAAVAACGPAVTITRDASLPIYPRTTYAWGAVDGPRTAAERDAREVNDSVRARIVRAIDAELALRGFQRVAFDRAQLVVHYHIGVQQRVDTLRSVPACDGKPCIDGVMSWGFWGAPEASIREVPYAEGSLMLDFLTQPALKLAWRGHIAAEVTDRSSSEAVIRRGIARLLRDFPGAL